MFIEIAPTPNDHALKFLPGKSISNAPKHFSNVAEAENISPLAIRLFAIKGVNAVFLGKDFITITKEVNYQWEQLNSEIVHTIKEYLVNNLPIILNGGNEQLNKNFSRIEQKIIEIIDTRVRPSVAMDGGDIEFSSFENGVVRLILKGACGGCPSASITLKDGIESMLKYYVPEVNSVESI